MFPRSYPGGNGLSLRRTGSIVGVRNTSTRPTRLRSQGSRTLWRIRDTPTCPRKNSKSCTFSSWNGIAARRTKAPRLRKVSRADDSAAKKSASVTRNRVEAA